MGKAKLEIRELIKGDLKTKIDGVWLIGRKEYQSFQQSNDSSNQGTVHCETVERNIGWLIPDEEKHEIGQFGLFVLSAAACLHDVGKVPLEYAMYEDHGRESMRRIVDNPKDFGLDDGEALAVGWVVSAHNDGKLNELPEKVSIRGEDVPVREFAAIFKLADMLDTNYERVPDSVLKMRYPDGNIPPKLTARKAITGWDIDSQNHIILEAYPKDEIGEETAYTACTLMNEEISSVATALCLLGYPAEFKLNINPYRIEQGLITESRKDRAFLGMASFTEADASRFRGRGADTQELLGYVTTYPITLLVGESGVGKTSLIQAGLFPKLNGWGWKYAWTRPFDDPAASIGKMVADVLLPSGRMTADASLIDTLRAVSAEHPDKKVLVAIDQFEDVLNSTDGELTNILRSLLAIQTGTVIPNLKVLIAFRGDLWVELDKRLFKDVVGSVRGLPSVGIVSLDRKGAGDAFIAGFKAAGVGLDATPDEQNGKSLMEVVLDEIEEMRFYPPYIQMVGETLCKHADEYGIVTREAYLKLGGVKRIIAEYLFNLLDEFGEHEKDARKILIALVTSKGTKKSRTVKDIVSETGIAYDQVCSLLDDMVDLRMVGSLGDSEYEIIHDYFGEMVSKELMEPIDKELKTVLEQLEHAADAFSHRGVIIDSLLMIQAYSLREYLLNHIHSNKNMWKALLAAQFNGNGPAWFWLKIIDTNELLSVVFELCAHRDAKIRASAMETIRDAYMSGNVASKDLSFIRKMLKDSDEDVRQAALEILKEFGSSEDIPLVKEMIRNERNEWIAYEMLKKFGSSDDIPFVREMLKYNHTRLWGHALETLKVLSSDNPQFVRDMLNDDNEFVREAAFNAMGELGNSDDIPTIREMLNDDSKLVQEAALSALKVVRISNNPQFDRDMLEDENSSVRIAALEALKEFGSSDDIPTIREMLNDDDIYVRVFASDTIEALRYSPRVQYFRKSIEDQPWDVTALNALKELGNSDDLPRIRKAIEYTYGFDGSDVLWVIYPTACETFEALVGRENISIVQDMIKNGGTGERIAAIGVFKKIGSRDDLPLIRKMLKDDDGRVQISLLDVIKELGTEDDLDLFAENAPIVIALDKRLYYPYNPSKIS
jgi:HEAT repeat protein